VLTNVAHEHLEFHGTFEKYLDDKANLFRALGRVPAKNLSWPRTGVVNRDDPHWEYFTAATKIPCLFYGIDNMAADMSASSLAPNQGGTDFILKNRTDAFSARLPLAGVFNVENLLAAVCTVASISGENMARLIPLFAALKPVRGRMERVECGQGFRVIVDFAHTPQAFQKLLPGMRKETEGKLIVVFGSAGERDTGKRKMQGEVASRFADIIVLTDEDPRAEERLAILEEIASGCLGKHREENLFLIPERRQAIAKACALAEKGDTVLLLGKGHEKSIIYKDRVLPWNERAVAEEVLHELGY
jgi:UDP-N-acetylmuramoyl-L-alanyl-D-glutamate--2,6-diaminopimelate ligase